MPQPLRKLLPRDLRRVSTETLAHYDANARSFWAGTKDHDVTENIEALLRHLEGGHLEGGSDGPRKFSILDLGCGPGRDLVTFRDLGHAVVGLDGAPSFVAMARKRSGCEVLQQDLMALDLPEAGFDGIFANAVLFHVPTQETPRVLGELHRALRPGGILFCSNPRGPDIEGVDGDRYGCWLTLATWRCYMIEAKFEELEHYFRPAGRALAMQPWLATVWRRVGLPEASSP